ncbi:MAG TPA: glycosyltransferase [bacterium]|nr:glycosyltransferase [bacterium]
MSKPVVTVVVPTYNERETIVALIGEILSSWPGINILVVDDASPDETAREVLLAFPDHERVNVLVRKGKRGRGLAGREGFQRALESGSDIVGEMDADFSHHPRFIPSLVAALEDADVAIGSRYLPGGGLAERGWLRTLVTGTARFYLNLWLGLKLTDPTSGFRFFRKEALRPVLPLLEADDPFIVTELLFHLRRSGNRIVEVPIYFYQRRAGKSKLKVTTLCRYLWRVICLRWKWRGR